MFDCGRGGVAIIVLVLASGCLLAQPERPCSGGDKARLFDFWVGEWEVTQGGKLAGHNRIEPILDGCVLQESWKGASGSQGTSLNFYNPSTGKWQQFWVWKNGTTLELEGAFHDGKMVLQGESANRQGVKQLNRISWYNNGDGTVRQHWETSTDQGQSWTTVFDGLYRRPGTGDR